MNKTEIIDKIAEDKGITKKETDIVVNAFIQEIIDTIERGEKVSIIGFGSFEVRERKARDYRNPKTGEIVHSEAMKVPAFKAGQSLKDAAAK